MPGLPYSLAAARERQQWVDSCRPIPLGERPGSFTLLTSISAFRRSTGVPTMPTWPSFMKNWHNGSVLWILLP